MMVASRIFGI